MEKLNNLLRRVIKAISGYELARRGRGGSSFIAFAREDIEIQPFYDSLLLRNTKKNELKSTKAMYRYLHYLRLKTILEKYQINIVLDVGANRGEFSRDLRDIGYTGKIISFEPVSSTFKVLEAAASSDLNWEVYNLALGRQNSEQTINVADSSVFASFLKSNDWCEQAFGESSVASREETVTVRRLDEVLNETVKDLDKARIYLKMDTQGYDLEVFSGLGSLSGRVFALQSEVSVIPIYQDMPHLTDSISLFEKHGFELAGMYPVNVDPSTLRVIEFDCLMINSKIQKLENSI
ncbi:MAG TPA: FkbM family methyltransferase [Leptolyngbyaceae cyanobacterium]